MTIPLALEDGSRIGVIGGGPAGSLFAYFALTFAQRMDLDLRVDIYEPRDFTKPGPAGCNMCGGIVSESLVQLLALEGIDLAPTVVQRGIDSYVLHTDQESVRIDTPLKEKRIAAVHRGGGPRNVQAVKWGGLNGYLLTLAQQPKINVLEATRPFADRLVLVGDSGVTRLYKDGIGAAYRTAKAAARTAVFSGVSAEDFDKHFMPIYRRIARDNRFGRLIFTVVHGIKLVDLLLRGVLAMAAKEQRRDGPGRRMSIVLWDMFTGSAPYREIFFRTLDPRFLGRFMRESALPAGAGKRGKGGTGHGKRRAWQGIWRWRSHLPSRGTG